MSEITNFPQVTSLSQLKEYSKGQLVELPSFAEGQPFYARLIRPSMLELVKTGRIPNALLTTANELFKSGGAAVDVDDNESLPAIFGVMETLCEATFLEPTYDEIKESGIKLTDDQLMFVFNYTQVGVKALDSFRKK